MTVSRPKADTPAPSAPPATPVAATESFVINLCSSTTPMALTQPKLAELKDFTFFVSRRLEDGRERFRLHMGYFDSLLQAEDLLPVVREIYPGAWAGEAPGKRLRAKAAAAAAAAPAKPAPVSAPAPTPPKVSAPAPVVAAAAAVPAAPAPAPTSIVVPAAPAPEFPPELALLPDFPIAAAAQSAAPMAAPASAPVPEASWRARAMPAPMQAAPAIPSADILANTPTLSAAPDDEGDDTREAPLLKLELMPEPAPVAAAGPPPHAPLLPAPPVEAEKQAARAGAVRRDTNLPFDQRSNVREVMKALDESGQRLKMPPPLPAQPAVREPGVLPESRVMRLLEEKRGGDPLSTTSTPAAFAVQLQWSVQQIDLARVPPLAIFGAYTLYTVEGSREGRRWFGLRLGFFKDAHSAKQVAQYVRSEFTAVAVVPVSLKERDGATGPSGAAKAANKPKDDRSTEVTGEFKLLDDSTATPKIVPVDEPEVDAAEVESEAAFAAATAPAGAATKPGHAPRAGQRAVKPRANRVHASARRAPKTLEETLEILGADQLQIEGARSKKRSTESYAPRVEPKVQKNSAFSRLLDRLAERGR